MKYFIKKANNNEMLVVQDTEIFCIELINEEFDIYEISQQEVKWHLFEEIDPESAKNHYELLTGLNPDECEFFGGSPDYQEKDPEKIAVFFNNQVININGFENLKDMAKEFMESLKKQDK